MNSETAAKIKSLIDNHISHKSGSNLKNSGEKSYYNDETEPTSEAFDIKNGNNTSLQKEK